METTKFTTRQRLITFAVILAVSLVGGFVVYSRRPALTPPGTISKHGGKLSIDTIGIYGWSYQADDDLKLKSVSFVDGGDSMQLLTARVSRTGLLSICADTWPPKGFGPTQRLSNAEFEKGDRFWVMVYLKPRQLGSFRARGLRLVYERNGQSVTQIDPSISWDVDIVAPGQGQCIPVPGDPWLSPR